MGSIQWALGQNGSNWTLSEHEMEVLPVLYPICFLPSIGIYCYCLIYSSIGNISVRRSHSAVKTAAVMRHKRLMERHIVAFWTLKKHKKKNHSSVPLSIPHKNRPQEMFSAGRV